jgi:RNA polymerase sigma-70 factor (ECF subfamily)
MSRLPLRKSDESLMMRVRRSGDERAFASLVQRWETPIRRLCTRMTGDAHLAEELAQETFTRVFLSRDRYEPRARFSTYVWRVALNLCRDEQRRKARRETHAWEGEMQPIAAQTADEAMVSQEASGFVRDAVMALSDPYREVVVLRHYEGMKFREIGEVLGIPEGTVKSRMAEALTQLSRRLQPLTEQA